MAISRQRRCKHCNELFEVDKRNVWHQKYCGKEECRKVSKRNSQLKWLKKPENKDYFRGAINVKRVQDWRERNPGYSKRVPAKQCQPLQDVDSGQYPGIIEESNGLALQEVVGIINEDIGLILLGIISHLCGSALQDDIIKAHRNMIKRGQDIKNGILAYDKEKNIGLSANSSSA